MADDRPQGQPGSIKGLAVRTTPRVEWPLPAGIVHVTVSQRLTSARSRLKTTWPSTRTLTTMRVRASAGELGDRAAGRAARRAGRGHLVRSDRRPQHWLRFPLHAGGVGPSGRRTLGEGVPGVDRRAGDGGMPQLRALPRPIAVLNPSVLGDMRVLSDAEPRRHGKVHLAQDVLRIQQAGIALFRRRVCPSMGLRRVAYGISRKRI